MRLLFVVLVRAGVSITRRHIEDLVDRDDTTTPVDVAQLLAKIERAASVELCFPAVLRDEDALRMTLARGASVTYRRRRSRKTALHVAAELGLLNAVKILVTAGADLEARTNEYGDNNDSGATPLILASLNGHGHVVRFLLSQDADVHAISDSGVSALCEASMRGELDAILSLADAGADVNAVGANGQSPLMLACQSGEASAVQVLVQRGASEVAADEDGKTAADYAVNAQTLAALRDAVACRAADTRKAWR